MFAATLQPLWPSRPKTIVTLLFYFLKLYNFGLNEIFVGSTSSEVQHPWISKIKNFYSIEFYDAFVKVESENFHNFTNKKLVVSIFVTNIFERY